MTPDVIISLTAVGIAAAGFVSSLVFNYRNSWREEARALREQHQACELRLNGLQTQFEQLQSNYLKVLEEAVRRGMSPQVVVHQQPMIDGH